MQTTPHGVQSVGCSTAQLVIVDTTSAQTDTLYRAHNASQTTPPLTRETYMQTERSEMSNLQEVAAPTAPAASTGGGAVAQTGGGPGRPVEAAVQTVPIDEQLPSPWAIPASLARTMPTTMSGTM